MNDVQFVEASRAMAQRILKEGGDRSNNRIGYAFLLTVGRAPTDDELAVVSDVLADAEARYQQNPDAAGKLISIGESKPDPTVNPQQLAAWTMVSNLLLNLDETISK